MDLNPHSKLQSGPPHLFFSLILVALLGSVHCVIAHTNSPAELNPGATVVREIDKGGKQLFQISLYVNQVLQISIDKGDLRLAVSLYDPDGRRVTEQQSHDFETINIFAVSQSSGTHRLEITSLESREGQKRFTLKAENLRTVNANDLKRVLAHDATATASLRRAEWNKDSLDQAVEKYRKASDIWNSIGDLRLAARASMAAAGVYLALGKYRDALRLYEVTAKQAIRIDDPLIESEALSQTGRLLSLLGRNDDAMKHVSKALAFYTRERSDNQPTRAHSEALANLGEVSYSKGDFLKASSNFAQALKISSELGDRKGMARARLFMGYIAGGLGDVETAALHISEALAIYKETGDKSGEALSMTALGLFYSFKGNNESAIQMHQDAREILRVIGDQPSQAITIIALGQAYELLTQYTRARDHYFQALKIFEQNENLDFIADALFLVGGTYRLLGDNNKALEFYEQCLKASRLTKKRRTEANALKDVAALYAARGEPEKALRQYRKTLDYFHSIEDKRGLSIALYNQGDFLIAIGDKQKALSSYRDALSLAEQTGEAGVQINILYGMARIARDSGLIDDARRSIKRSVDLIEEVRSNVTSPDFRTSYFSAVRKHYELYIDILMSLDRQRPGQEFAAAALMVSESARARSLVDLLIEAKADIRQGADPQLVKRETELEALLRAEAQYQLETQGVKLPPEDVAERTRQIEELRIEYQELQGKVRNRNQRYLNLVQSRPITLSQIQHELSDGETLLLEYALGEENSYLWVVSKDSLKTYVLPGREKLEQMGREVYDLLTARSTIDWRNPQYAQQVEAADRQYVQKGRELSQMLLGEAWQELQNKRLLVVTEGMLQYVPLDALPAPSGDSSENVPFVIDSHEVVTLPSISTLAVIRREQERAPGAGKVVAVFADPVFDVNDERVDVDKSNSSVRPESSPHNTSQRLVHTAAETEAILRVVPRRYTLVATDFEATRETLMGHAVEEFEILHLATHGVINTEHPELSGILLSMVNHNGNRKEGFLALNDVYRLSLSARLTVLSACETALGKNVRGEGLVGLTRGFMFAGSQSVIASLWKVDDRATADLMGHLYQRMLRDGLSPAVALRSAKATIKQQKAWRAPYFWAGFTLQGEYNQRIAVSRSSVLYLYFGVGLLILIAGGLLLLKFRRGK